MTTNTPTITDEQIIGAWDEHVVPVFDKNGINPIVFARAIESLVLAQSAPSQPNDDALIQAIDAELASWTGDHRRPVMRAFADMLDRYRKLQSQASQPTSQYAKDADMFVAIVDDGLRGKHMEYAEPGYGGKRIIGKYACYLVDEAIRGKE